MPEQIGTLIRLRRYPVKSMAGEDLREARVTFAGISGDRVYAFIDSKFGPPDFPWMTGRQGHDLILFRPRFLDAPPIEDGILDADRFSTEVTTPDGEKFRMGDPCFTEYLEQRFQRSLRLRFSERSMTDARPVSIFSSATISALSEEANLDLDARRFRANFYVEWKNDAPFFEDSLVGRELQIGELAALQVVKKDQRCVMITLDPETAVSAPQVLARVSRNHEGCAGVYAAVLREGIVRVEDPIYLI
jgi:MOSC domain-containing protein